LSPPVRAASTPPPIVAIDGPSGAGKSTVARALAARLGVPYIDTGAMYRAIGLAARERGVVLPIADPDAVGEIAGECSIDLDVSADGTRVVLNGRDVSDAIRLPEISRYASAVSSIPAVRKLLVAEQRRLAADRGGVLEGRDIGTRVFPDTPHKFFLTAPLEVRAERRAKELAVRGTPQPPDVVREEIARRDTADSTRADSPLTLDPSYTVIDTGRRDVEEIVSDLEARVRTAAGRSGDLG
jgi:cytidylate kinase